MKTNNDYPPKNNYLPGDLSYKEIIHRMIRVNQAGEYGAKRIYEGQLAILKNNDSKKIVKEMYEQELKHLDSFNNMMVKKKVRPTLLQPLWHIAGFALGASTALLGEKTAMACTVAVEEAIDEHYRQQEDFLINDDTENDDELRNLIIKTRQDEINHLEVAIDNNAEKSPVYSPMKLAIKNGTKVAIWLSERI